VSCDVRYGCIFYKSVIPDLFLNAIFSPFTPIRATGNR
jgi:hypothetical protein